MQGQQKSSKQKFFWVNKDAKSSDLSRSTGDEAASILRHVHQPGHRKAQRRRKKGLGYDHIAFEVIAQPEHESASSERVTEQQLIHRPYSMRKMQSRWRVIPNNNIGSGTGLDPFSSSAVPLTEEIHSLLLFARRHISVGTGGYRNDIFLRSNRPLIETYQHATFQMLTDSIRHEHALWPLLASFSLRMKSISNVPFVAALNPEKYHQKGLQALRKQLDKTSDDDSKAQLGTGIHYMICSAGMMQRSEEMLMHISGMMKWLKSMEKENPSTILHFDLVRSWDNLIAASSGKKPVFASAVSDPGGLHEKRVRELRDGLSELQESLQSSPSSYTVDSEDVEELNTSMAKHRKDFLLSGYGYDLMVNPIEDLSLSLGSGLRDGLDRKILPFEIMPTIEKILEALLMAKAVWRLPAITDSNDSVWVCKRIRTIAYELLSMDDLDLNEWCSGDRLLAEAMRRALIIILLAAQYRTVNKARIFQVRLLQEVLMSLIGEESFPTPLRSDHFDTISRGQGGSIEYNRDETLLWLLVTGCWAAQDIEECSWFLTYASDTARYRLRLHDYDDLHQVMDKYLYSKTVQRQILEAVATML